MQTTLILKTWLAALLIGSLSACGGADEAGAEVRATKSASVAPLLDDEGRPASAMPSAVPTDPQARTRSDLYATPEQATALASVMGSQLIDLDVGCCAAQGADLAVLITFGLQAAQDLPNDVPVLVRGNDQRLAAATADRLAADGFSRVWVVTR